MVRMSVHDDYPVDIGMIAHHENNHLACQ
jgi:hypothetical protein